MRGFMRSTHASDNRANKATPGGCSRCNRGRHCNHGGPQVRNNRSIHVPRVVETPISPDNGHGDGQLPPDQIPKANIVSAERPVNPTADVSELPHREGGSVQAVEGFIAGDGASTAPVDTGSRTSIFWCGPTQDGGKGVKACDSPRAIHPGELSLYSILFVFRLGRKKRVRRGSPWF